MGSSLDNALILKSSKIKPKVIKFLVNLQKDKKLANRFIKNPVQVLDEIGELPKGADVSASNRLLFSLLSNKSFINWANLYSRKVVKEMGENPSLEKIRLEKVYIEMMKGISKYADKELMISIFGDRETVRKKILELTDTPESSGVCVALVVWLAVVVLPVLVLLHEPVERSPTSRFLGRDDLAQLVDALNAKLKETSEDERKKGNLGRL